MRRVFPLLLALPLVTVCGDAAPLPTAAQTTIVSVSPTPHATSADRQADILVIFTTPVAPATVRDGGLSVYGRWSGSIAGSFSFEADDRRVRFTPTRPFAAGEWVQVNLGTTVRHTDGRSLDHGYSWGFYAATKSAGFAVSRRGERSVRRPGEPHIQTYGAYAGDFDGDGYSDLMVPNEQSNDVRIFLNDGTGDYGPFTVYPVPGASSPSTNEGADFNRDGLVDFAVGSGGNDQVGVFFGTGDGTFRHTQNLTAGNSVRGLCVGDYDGDGWTDVATANRDGGVDGNVTVFLNDGAGRFGRARVIEAGGRGETACASADVDRDGILDLVIGALESREIIVLRGDGTGGFTITSRTGAGGTPWMIAAGDLNGDGHVDIATANNAQNTTGILLGDGAGGFALGGTYPSGQTPLAVDLGDLDGDGDLDVVTSNYGSADFTVYRNPGTGRLQTEKTLQSGRSGSCAILHDRDGDGDLDITGVDELDDILILFDNQGR